MNVATTSNGGASPSKPKAANRKPRAASDHAKVSSTAKSKTRPRPDDAPVQMGPEEIDAVHRKAIDSIDLAGTKMSVARANVEMAKSKEDRNKAVAKAGEVVGPALLAPSRHVAKLLRGIGGTLFLPCKQVGSSLASLTKHEANRHEKDVRVAIIHFDLARALVHIGSLNRESRPAKSIADPLSKLLNDFKDIIQEFDLSSEDYYESVLKHLPHRKWNKDKLNSFADRIAHFKKSLISLLTQQAVQHPGKHADVLAQIESRLEANRAFFATNEEIAEAYLSKQLKGEVSVRPVQDGRPKKRSAGTAGHGGTKQSAGAVGHGSTKQSAGAVGHGSTKQSAGAAGHGSTKPSAGAVGHGSTKQSAGAVGQGGTHGISSAKTKATPSTLPNPKRTRRSKVKGTLGKLVPFKKQKHRVNTKPARPHPPTRRRFGSKLKRTLGKLVCVKQRRPRPPTRRRFGSKLKRTLGKLVCVNVKQQDNRVHKQAPMTTNQSPNTVANHHSYPPEAGSEEGGAYSGDPEHGDEFEDSEEGAGDFSDPDTEPEDEYSNSEEGSGESPDPEYEDQHSHSEE